MPSDLQRQFNEMVERAKKTPAKAGFFGGSDGKSKEDDILVINCVQLILQEGLRMRASDVHIEPLEGSHRVRFRVDGMLEEVLDIPRALDLRIVSRVRVMGGLDPEQAIAMGKPQDGRFMMNADGQEADVRLSTFPTSHGDKAVLRIIPRLSRIPKIEELGLARAAAERLREMIVRPQGMMVVTGPSGSGKSTTLYTILQTLNEPSRNIVTLEDPVECKLPGITQGSLQPKVGFTFAEGLRSILRQDPNVIMVGEIRDRETAEIAMSAALTGHMLFTSLHTTSALGAISRLIDMGIEPFLISSALTAVYAQRLARRVCLKCKEEHQPTQAELAQVEDMAGRHGVTAVAGMLPKTLHRGKGCPACRGTGLLGRILIYESVELNAPLRELILQKAPTEELRRAALQAGCETLLLDGFKKAAAGVTTLSELVRVLA